MISSPGTVTINASEFTAAVCVVHNRDILGRPVMIEIIPKEEILAKGDQRDFILGYFPAERLRAKTKRV